MSAGAAIAALCLAAPGYLLSALGLQTLVGTPYWVSVVLVSIPTVLRVWWGLSDGDGV